MYGSKAAGLRAVPPLKDSVMAGVERAEAMLRYFIQRAHNRGKLVRPRVVICVPPCITSVEKRAVRESALSAGAREVYLMEEPMAAAIGAGLDVTAATGNMVVDIGGGTTDVAVISLAGIPKVVVASSEEIAEALVEPIHSIVETVHLTLEKTPPELAADIVDRGIMLVGGGSLLRDFDHVLRQETKLPILRSDDPFTAVVHGAGKALENLQLLKDVALN